MKIGFPPERIQPPPHYAAGPRVRAAVIERAVVRAIVHPDAIRIAAPAPRPWPLPSSTPCAPHAIAFERVRPPPGTVAVAAVPRPIVRAIVRELDPRGRDAALRSTPVRPERRATAAVAPHRIAFGAPIAPPYPPS